jgi:hypothetical protein
MTTERDLPQSIQQEEGGQQQDLKKEKENPSDRLLGGGIWIEIDSNLKPGDPIRVRKGHVHLSEEGLNQEKAVVKKALSCSIEESNEEIFIRMTKGLENTQNPDLQDLYQDLLDAFKNKTKNPFNLAEINVDLLTNGIAERNLIREALKSKITQLPFRFKNKNGELVEQDKIDYIFVRDTGGKYRLIVGSKQGIAMIEVPDKLKDDQFHPDLTKVDRNPNTDAIIFPLGRSKDKSDPIASIIEIIKSPIDIIQLAAREELEAQRKKAKQAERERKKEIERERERRYRENQTYNPPPPSAPRRSSESGGYGYTRVSN